MIELSRKSLDTFKNNLISRRSSFKIVIKRSETTLVRSGVEIARLKTGSGGRLKIKNDGLVLFSNVKKSINKFIIDKGFDIEEVYQLHPAKLSNRVLFHDLDIGAEFILIDVKHCYWRIAYLKGYVSKKLYESVIEHEDPQFKLWRNMSLSCIIAPKKVQVFKNGREYPLIEEDTTLYKRIYSNIRFTAWNIFGNICENIGLENVLGYNTDGIMVFQEHIAKVTSVLSRNKLKYTIKKCFKHSHNEYVTEKGKIYKI